MLNSTLCIFNDKCPRRKILNPFKEPGKLIRGKHLWVAGQLLLLIFRNLRQALYQMGPSGTPVVKLPLLEKQN